MGSLNSTHKVDNKSNMTPNQGVITSQMHHPLGSLRQLSDTEFLPLEQLPKELKEFLNKLVAAKVYYGSEPLLLRYLNPSEYDIRTVSSNIVDEGSGNLDSETNPNQKSEPDPVTLSVTTGMCGEKKLYFHTDNFRCKDCTVQQSVSISTSTSTSAS